LHAISKISLVKKILQVLNTDSVENGEFLQSYECKLKLIKGIIFKSGGRVVETLDTNPVCGLPTLNWDIERFGLSWEDYIYPDHKIQKLKDLRVDSSKEAESINRHIAALSEHSSVVEIPSYTSFTCPHYFKNAGCTFCDIAYIINKMRNSANFMHSIRKIRSDDIERLKMEFENLSKSKIGKRNIIISYNADACTYGMWKLIISLIRENDLNVKKISLETRVDLLTDRWLEDARNLSNSGIITSFQIGFEFGNDKDLKFIKKGICISQSKELIEKLKGYNEWTGFLILSSQKANKESLEQNIRFAEHIIERGGKVSLNPWVYAQWREKVPYFKKVRFIGGKKVSSPLSKPLKCSKNEMMEMINFTRKKLTEHKESLNNHSNTERKRICLQRLYETEERLLNHLQIQYSRLF
jgi:radical SAM superfamily enzyme YgiQ (UPF0313 family)